MMVMKATTPPTMPMMTESMLVRPLDCLGWALGTRLGRLVVGRLVVGSQMMSSSDSVGLVRGGAKVTSMVVVGAPGPRVSWASLATSHRCMLRALQSQ